VDFSAAPAVTKRIKVAHNVFGAKTTADPAYLFKSGVGGDNRNNKEEAGSTCRWVSGCCLNPSGSPCLN
jgi:hypothetical protein